MRAHIGPYPKHWTTANLESRWIEFHHGMESCLVEESMLTQLDHLVIGILDGIQAILNKTINRFNEWRGRKVRVHVDYYDTWSVDHTLALVILPIIEQLREKKQGAPNVDLEDVPRELRGKKLTKKQKADGEVDDKHFERWDYVLDEMIFAFESIVDDSWEEQFFSGESDLVWTPVDVYGNEVSDDYDGEEYYRMDTGPNSTLEFDKKGFDKYNERINSGLRLFGKYFRALWD